MATQFRKIASVTLSVLKFQKGQPRYVALLGAMYRGEQVKGKKTDDGKVAKEPAVLIHAVDMETGEEGLIIAPVILQKELDKNYPNSGYVGRGFEIIVTRDATKDYNHCGISEVEIPAEMTEKIKTLMQMKNMAQERVAVVASATNPPESAPQAETTPQTRAKK